MSFHDWPVLGPMYRDECKRLDKCLRERDAEIKRLQKVEKIKLELDSIIKEGFDIAPKRLTVGPVCKAKSQTPIIDEDDLSVSASDYLELEAKLQETKAALREAHSLLNDIINSGALKFISHTLNSRIRGCLGRLVCWV